MKKRIRKTGEIVDVIAWYNIMGAERDKDDSVSYIDSKGNECVKVEGLNLAWDFEDVKEVLSADIDWEQRRYEIAKTMMHAIYLDDGNAEKSDKSGFDFEYKDLQGSAKEAVRFADALIAELKKGGER